MNTVVAFIVNVFVRWIALFLVVQAITGNPEGLSGNEGLYLLLASFAWMLSDLGLKFLR